MIKVIKHSNTSIDGTNFQIVARVDKAIGVYCWEKTDEDGIPVSFSVNKVFYLEHRKNGQVGARLDGKLVCKTTKTLRQKIESLVGCPLDFIFHPVMNVALSAGK